MNDRFSSELRQHLLSTAQERPAEGQLAAVLQAVAGTAQRRSIVARLTWFPGRLGPFPSTAVRLGLIAVALILAAVVGAVIVASTPKPPSTVFEGTWTSIDPGDGSTQTLVIGEGSRPVVHFVDSYATGAACVNDPVKVFTAEGVGTVIGTTLRVGYPDGGGCGLDVVGIATGVFNYAASTDTIIDDQQLTWTRSRIAVAPPTRGPLPAELRTAPPALCADIPVTGSYRHDVGSLSLSVTIPAAAAFTWQGYRDEFDVSTSCWFEGRVGISAEIVRSVDASCDASPGTGLATPEGVVAALAGAQGVVLSEPFSTTLAGYPATWFEVAPEARMCFDELVLWNERTIVRGTTTFLYVVDVDGQPLGIMIQGGGDSAPAQLAEARSIVATLQIGAAADPQPASAPLPTIDAACLQFGAAGTYEAPVGQLAVGVTVPAEPGTYWHGLRDRFNLSRSPCQFGAPITLEGSIVAHVPPDPCQWFGAGTELADAAAAATALAGQSGTDTTEPAELTIDGHRAFRLDSTVTDATDSEYCAGNQLALWLLPDGSPAAVYPGATVTVYLIDVDESILAVLVRLDPDAVQVPGASAEIDTIVGSLDIKALGGASG